MPITRSTSGAAQRWGAAAIASAVVILAVMLLFRSPSPTLAPLRHDPTSPVRISPRAPQELAMRDLEPLFLPTKYNAAPVGLTEPDPAAKVLELHDEKWQFAVENPALKVPAMIQPPAKPADTLADTPGPLALGFGELNVNVTPATRSGAHVDVFAADRHDTLLAVTLPVDARPTLAGRDTPSWQPLEFCALVEPSGLVGELLLTRSSEAEEVDNYFRVYLAQSFRLGDRLPPGFYRIVVAP